MSTPRHHAEWLSLVEVSGPFLSLPVLLRVFPQGLDGHDPAHFLELRTAYEEWLDNQGGVRPEVALHREWIRFVLEETLGWPREQLRAGQALPPGLDTLVSEHHETLRPDFALVSPPGRENGKVRVLVQLYPAAQKLGHVVPDRQWKADPATRMLELLKATGVALGLVTNGEHWMLVYRPAGEGSTTYASWYANLWTEEQITLRAFRSLLGQHRLFGVADADTLEALFAESAQNQQEVTDQLGYQVRKAVEVLVQALDRQDKASGRTLLAGLSEKMIYEAALTVMMRLVFLFSAEERGLLLLGDPLYDQHYAVSTLRAQLREDADAYGEEVLENRHDAWCRLLATFRVLYGGIAHERLRSPAYGGSLFNPDRFPFLEGRASGTVWRETPAHPLPINNRTVLHLLEALQILQVKVPGGGPAEARRLSFRALDIEQIGHVYEGLLDHTAVRTAEPVLGLLGSKDKEEEIPLAELEGYRARGEAVLVAFLKERTGRSESALHKAVLSAVLADERKLRAACENDAALLDRVRPFTALLRDDTTGYPVVIPAGSTYVTHGEDRRSSGTHYTPRSLTEPIVRYTLEPLVYLGPAEGTPRAGWALKSARDILALKVCDMAMGSGAFLVQACRYLAERLVEAWAERERQADGRLVVTPEGDLSTGDPYERPLPRDDEERLAIARRIVAAQCLYGVDINPMAVEMAKLSLWLVTLAKGKPFTFLDHALKCGDSLLGVDMAQLKSWSLDRKVEGTPDYMVMEILTAAQKLREELEHLPADGGIEVEEAKENLHRQAEHMLQVLKTAGDLILATAFERGSSDHAQRAKELQDAFYTVYKDPSQSSLIHAATRLIPHRHTFHWPLEFPEVIAGGRGFNAIIGNPPFLGGLRISEVLGEEYNEYLANVFPPYSKRVDICAYFFRRAGYLIISQGSIGLLATNTISQGTTRRGGLDILESAGLTIYRAIKSFAWPGSANVIAALVILFKGKWSGERYASSSRCEYVSTLLEPETADYGAPEILAINSGRSYQGSVVWGDGFLLTPAQAQMLIEQDTHNSDVVKPLIGGEELNNQPDLLPTRWVIDMGERNEEDVRHYTEPYLHLLEYVKPFRMTKDPIKYKRIVDGWWKYFHSRLELYRGIRDRNLKRILVRARVSDHHMIALLPVGYVYTEQLVVYLFETHDYFSILQSTLHDVWARRFASTLKTDVRYVVSDCFETFPLATTSTELCEIGNAYYTHRSNILTNRWQGLTKTYNEFHNQRETDSDIQHLRELHIELDQAVTIAYGWNDLRLDHSFYDTKQGIRFTISEAARREVLDRLLRLNHERYAEEVAAGLHEKGAGKATPKGKRAGKKTGGAISELPGL